MKNFPTLCLPALLLCLLATPSFADDEPAKKGELVEKRIQIQLETPTDQLQDVLLEVPAAQTEKASTEEAELRKRYFELREKQEKLTREYQEAMQALQQALPRAAQIEAERQKAVVQWQSATAQQAAAQQAAAAKQVELAAKKTLTLKTEPLPPNASIRAFKLRFIEPGEIGQALHMITAGSGPRVAIDERTNTLVIAGDDKQMQVVEQVVETLDQPSERLSDQLPDSLQIRMLWLLDNLEEHEGQPPEPPFVSPKVTQALVKLGFQAPRVVCQQVTTLTLAKNRGGEFNFETPVLLHGNSSQFEGQGFVAPTADGRRYSLSFTVSIREPNDVRNSQLTGSVVTPLAHYTVMGTNTLVTAVSQSDAKKTQRLSAFVVYLDKPQEFSSDEPKKK
jgi:hypothetical protein